MKAKVYLNRVKTDYKKDFEKVKQYFSKHDIDFDFSFEETDLKNLKYTKHKLWQGERILLNPVHTLVPENDSDITIFAFDGGEFIPPNIPTGLCDYVSKKPFIYVETNKTNPATLDYVNICHELMHALVYIARLKGFLINDVMDSYRDNFNPDSPTGNFAHQWMILSPFVTYIKGLKIDIREAILTRGYLTSKQQVGTLVAHSGDNTAYFQTLELPYKNNQINISSIPVGKYICKYNFSPKFNKYTYQIMNVNGRSGIRIHSGNRYIDIMGCILLGKELNYIDSDKELDTKYSTEAVEEFEKFMERKDFSLIIKSHF